MTWLLFLDSLVRWLVVISIAPTKSFKNLSMQHTGHTQHELRDLDLELRALTGLHLVAAAHRAALRGQHRAAGIFEALAGFEQRLLAHHALPAHFLHMVVGIGDDPVTADELGGRAAEIGDGDGVGKHETVARLIGLLRQVIHLRLYIDAMWINLFHARHLNRFSLMSQGLSGVFMLIFASVFQAMLN